MCIIVYTMWMCIFWCIVCLFCFVMVLELYFSILWNDKNAEIFIEQKRRKQTNKQTHKTAAQHQHQNRTKHKQQQQARSNFVKVQKIRLRMIIGPTGKRVKILITSPPWSTSANHTSETPKLKCPSETLRESRPPASSYWRSQSA